MTVAGVDGLVGRDEDEASRRRARPRPAPAAASRARCCAPPRPGWAPSARRACRRRRGRRPSGGARRRPRASARPPCSRRARRRATRDGRGGRPRARAGSEEVVLGVVEQDQPARRDARDLAAELRADRAAGAGDEHDLAVEVRADAVELHPHRLAARGCPRPATSRTWRTTVPAGLQQLEDRRQRAHRDAALAARAHDARAQRARRRRDRDRHLVGLGLVEDARRGRSVRAEHAHAVDPRAPLERVVVDEADRR